MKSNDLQSGESRNRNVDLLEFRRDQAEVLAQSVIPEIIKQIEIMIERIELSCGGRPAMLEELATASVLKDDLLRVAEDFNYIKTRPDDGNGARILTNALARLKTYVPRALEFLERHGVRTIIGENFRQSFEMTVPLEISRDTLLSVAESSKDPFVRSEIRAVLGELKFTEDMHAALEDCEVSTAWHERFEEVIAQLELRYPAELLFGKTSRNDPLGEKNLLPFLEEKRRRAADAVAELYGRLLSSDHNASPVSSPIFPAYHRPREVN